jgi:PAS domain-containing protein
MTPPADLPPALLTASDVLDQVSTGVVVIDRDCLLLYANSFAVTLFGFPDDSANLAGRPLLSLGIE